MPRVARLYRHPIKGIGAEPLERTAITAGACLPGDRVWAVAHEAAKLADGWSPCMNFVRGAKSPALMAVTARLEGDGVALSHPDRPDISLKPDTEGDRLIDWVRQLCNPDRAAPARVVRAGRGMTDTPFPSVSIMNTASHAVAFIERVGADNLFIHLDTYHMNIEETGYADGFLSAGQHLGYVHLSEANRGTPGQGTIDWMAVFGGLREVGFTGTATLESMNYTAPEIASGLAIWRPVAADKSDVVSKGIPFLTSQARLAGQPFGED